MSKKLKVKNKYEKNNDVAMTWRIRWLNRNVATINAMLLLLDIYIYIYIYRLNRRIDNLLLGLVLQWYGRNCIRIS